MNERTTDGSVSRRNVLKKASGLLAGGALLSGHAAANHGRLPAIAQSQSAWTDDYSGRLDGRDARLTIRAANPNELEVILEDRDRNVTLSGNTPVPIGSNDHVISDLRLESSDGQHKVIERLYRHGFDDDHISGYTRWRGTNYGLAFSSSGVRASAGNGPRFDRNSDDWPEQWEYTYRGRNDGRRADLYIRVLDETGTTVRFFVGLYDRERGNYFKGETEMDRNSPSHIMSDLTLETDDGGTKTVDRLYLHTWDTNYVSGRTEWRGNYYGLHFAQEY